ncbi:MarR family transcriptional regulator, partial [Singulisphaera rosea]
GDRRSSLIRLTAAALAKLPELTALRSQAAEEALSGFDEAERELLAGMLMRIIANVEKAATGGNGSRIASSDKC